MKSVTIARNYAEALFEAAAVLAGTILMATGIGGNSPTQYDSSTTLSTLMPRIAHYRDEFYRPYMKYPGKIIAIPGNHDGETFKATDPVSLQEFRNYFCAPSAQVPSIAADVRIFRETMTQPGVYWMLSAPFANIIGLYSNIAEGPGNLLGANGDDRQIKWLTKTLTSLKQSGDRKALIIATQRPRYTGRWSTATLKSVAVPSARISLFSEN